MIRALIRNSGLNLRCLRFLWPDWMRYCRDRRRFRAMAGAATMPWGRELPIFGEWREASGSPGAYFFQDRLVARWLLAANPARHVDIGSRIDVFIGHLSVFREVEVIDIRPQPTPVPGVKFHQIDLTEPLPKEWNGTAESVSCLHTIEHFGLGRYGDAIDPGGHMKGLAQLKRMVRPGGRLYLSTPIGRERIEYNAHRIFAPLTMLSWFEEGWEIERSAWIDDELNVSESHGDAAVRNASGDAGVGILCLRKLP